MKKWMWQPRKERFAGRIGDRELIVRLMREDEIDLVMDLQTRVRSHMPDPSLMAPELREQVEESLQMDICLGIYDDERLVAVSIMVVNRDSEERNIGQENGFSPEECVSFDIIFVDPDYRGLGIQAYFLHVQDGFAAQLNAKRALVTVSPENAYSLRNIRENGFEIFARSKLYGGLDRYILKKEYI